MPLKPEGVGFLIKAVACNKSRIIFGTELQESPSEKEFSMHMMKSAACTLRLVKQNKKKTLCCFASVQCAIELLLLKGGLNFTGIMKGRSSEFPMQDILS